MRPLVRRFVWHLVAATVITCAAIVALTLLSSGTTVTTP